MQKSLAKLSIFCENTKGFDLFCLFLLINQEKLRKIFAESRRKVYLCVIKLKTSTIWSIGHGGLIRRFSSKPSSTSCLERNSEKFGRKKIAARKTMP